ncbi:cystathionine gamma-synthase 1, chloroplastic-like [Cornus florida]|uniref:cystathionine gamma-synthase 1, chloroplastic-like n=1 Tax=Cornus florida TaxID=4283 RepID=UPI00289CEFAF|nr:cystathionine gamma-synthase 1, chloroplastic-like [Cornus florida]
MATVDINGGGGSQMGVIEVSFEFCRQLNIKAWKNCSNIGMTQVVADSWSNNQAADGVTAATKRIGTTSSPIASPPAPSTSDAPVSSPSGTAVPPSFSLASRESPSSIPNGAALNRVTVGGPVAGLFFVSAFLL